MDLNLYGLTLLFSYVTFCLTCDSYDKLNNLYFIIARLIVFKEKWYSQFYRHEKNNSNID